MEILAHRILWSFVFVIVIIFIQNQWNKLIEILKNKRNRRSVFISGLLISSNWLLYIWAVNANHVVEASLGYYINPLISIALGMIVLKEKLNFWQLISLSFAIIGVLVITIQLGKAPWIALFLAISFGLYGLSKKMLKMDATVGLAAETLFVAPIALAYILFVQLSGSGSSLGDVSLGISFLLLGAGIVTAMPLIWFAQATGRVSLSTVGFVQYLAPSISLLLGVFVFKEIFTHAHLLSFSFIWTALLIYSFSRTPILLQLQPRFFKHEQKLSRE